MKIQEYKFVPEKGAVTTTADLNLREGKPMVTNTPISKEAGVGTMLNYIGYVLDGQEIGGISKWFWRFEKAESFGKKLTPNRSGKCGNVSGDDRSIRNTYYKNLSFSTGSAFLFF